MKQEMVGSIVCLAAVIGFGGSSAVADDRELQAILLKQACAPGSVNQTELSPQIMAYEVICRGSGRVLTVVCVNANCRLQSKTRKDDEGVTATESSDE